MTKLFRAVIISSRHGTRNEIAGEFDDIEWESLRQFAEYEEELSKTEFVAARMPLAGETNWSQERGWAIPPLPSAPVVRDLLMMLRPFLLQDEPTNFYKILKIISRRYESAELRANLQVLKDSFSGKIQRSLFEVSLNDLVINSDDGIKAWLNAFEYHRDVDKRRLFRSAADAVPLEVMKVFFLELIRDKVLSIEWLALFIRCADRSLETGHPITL